NDIPESAPSNRGPDWPWRAAFRRARSPDRDGLSSSSVPTDQKALVILCVGRRVLHLGCKHVRMLYECRLRNIRVPRCMTGQATTGFPTPLRVAPAYPAATSRTPAPSDIDL